MLSFTEIKALLNENPDFAHLLFRKGFVITDADIREDILPCHWEKAVLGPYTIRHDPLLPLFLCDNMFLLGHACNPYDMECNENTILRTLASLDGTAFFCYEANLTGNYVMGKVTEDGDLIHWADCAGMLASCYGRIGDYYYLTSHANIVAENCHLREDPYITNLKNSRYFPLFGAVLPGDLSPYRELKRTVPNFYYTSTGKKKRFFPLKEVQEVESEAEYQTVLEEVSKIFRNTMELYTRKWSDRKVGISLTGGVDSAVTMASANGHYDFFHCFSYISKKEEAVDAQAAARICMGLGVKHKTITIPETTEVADIHKDTVLKELIAFNGGNVGYLKTNEIRKRNVFLMNALDIDIEVKSWVDEITRAYRYKQYGYNCFPEIPNGKYLASFYKVFLENRILYRKTVKVFDEYIRDYMRKTDISLMGNWMVLWSWEFAHSASNGQHMTDEQVLAFDVAVPFNNRHLISTMLKTSIEDRIADRIQKDIVEKNNPEQAKLNISVINAAHTSMRTRLEKAYLIINTHLPF